MPGREMRNLYPNDPNVMGRNRFDPPRGIQVSAGLPTAQETGGEIDLLGIIGRMLAGEDEQAVTTQPPGPIPGETASQKVSGGGPLSSAAVPTPVDFDYPGYTSNIPLDTGLDRGPGTITGGPFTGQGLEQAAAGVTPMRSETVSPEQAAADVADVETAVVNPTRPRGARFANVMENVTDLPQGSTNAITSLADAARSRRDTSQAETVVPEVAQTVPETVGGPGGGRFDVPTAGVDTSDRYAGIAAENPSVNIDQGLIDTISGGGVPEQGNYGLDGRINEITRGTPGNPNSDVRSMIAAMQSESPLLAQLLEQLLANMVRNATQGRRF